MAVGVAGFCFFPGRKFLATADLARHLLRKMAGNNFQFFFLIDAVSELVGAGPDYGRWGSGLLLLPRSQVPGYIDLARHLLGKMAGNNFQFFS